MPTAAPCTDAEITHMVHAFYAKARGDALLGPVFAAQVDDWDRHLDLLSDFWSSVLLGSGRYHGMPMPKHATMPHLDAAMFERWLALFRETTAELGNPWLADHANAAAARMAQGLWNGYQALRMPGGPLHRLHPAG